jgi:serine protease Do
VTNRKSGFSGLDRPISYTTLLDMKPVPSALRRLLPLHAYSRLVPFLLAFTLAAADTEKPPPADGTDDLHSTPSSSGMLNRPAPPRLGEPINDKAVFRFLEAEGAKLLEAKRTLRDWQGRLGRKTCSLELAPPGAQKLTPAEIGGRAEAAVAVIGTFYLCGKCSHLHMATATGFFLNETGALATCRHVLASYNENGRGVVVLTRDGRVCPVRGVLAADPVHDLLVLQVEGSGFPALPLATNAPPGSPVTLVSHPENHFYMLTTGVVSRHGVQRRAEGLYRFLTITADFAKGSSGAPVCNESGGVIGLVDNTESIYYTIDHGQQNNLQMVLKNCSPSTALLELVKKR